MNGSAWIALTTDALAASVLVNAGLGKLVSPAALRGALHELAPAAPPLTDGAVRVLAVVEVAAGSGLLAPATRIAAGLVVAALGLGFAVVGTAGWLRGSTMPCGCVGGRGDRPLGVTNVAVGLALVAVLPLSLVAGVPPDASQLVLAATSLGSLLLCLWLNRRLAQSLLRPTVREGTP
jgi:uncharacterized membrane protein